MSCFRHTRTGRPKHHKSRQMRQQIRLQWLQRITDFSYPRPFVPKNERSLWRTFVPQELGNESSRNFRSGDLSFPGTFVLGERKFPGTFVPGPFRSPELSFPENKSSWELSFLRPFVPGNFRSHYPIGLVATLLCVLNCCMFPVTSPLWCWLHCELLS